MQRRWYASQCHHTQPPSLTINHLLKKIEKEWMIFGVMRCYCHTSRKRIDRHYEEREVQSELSKELFTCLKNTPSLFQGTRGGINRGSKLSGELKHSSPLSPLKTEDLAPSCLKKENTLFCHAGWITEATGSQLPALRCRVQMLLLDTEKQSVSPTQWKHHLQPPFPVCCEQNHIQYSSIKDQDSL